MAAGTCLLLAILWIHFVICVQNVKGGCTFNKTWNGRWFQSGLQSLLSINSTHIETKGECFDYQNDKYLVYNRQDNCYRCLAIHEKFNGVLQYKESICEDGKPSLSDVCSTMLGDDPLHTMFRKQPRVSAISCPFKMAPFAFSYSRGTGECSNPPSRAESCTDDSRIVFKYQACPDVPSTESYVEEMVCLAQWKEGSTRYLIGKLTQMGRNKNPMMVESDEDQYRCFIYQRDKKTPDRTSYSVAQSADATCTGIINSYEGSKTMRLTTVDSHHNRCKFPKWITDHHTWLSLDRRKIYKFTQRNATLKILEEEKEKTKNFRKIPSSLYNVKQSEDETEKTAGVAAGEMRVVCHAILESLDQKRVQIVAHITSGCDSGYVCMVFHKRDQNVIEIQQTSNFEENSDEACSNYSPTFTPFTTLVTTALHNKKCPNAGRYKTTIEGEQVIERRKKRRKRESFEKMSAASPAGAELECTTGDAYDVMTVGCTETHEMEFRPACTARRANSFSCHGSWTEDGVDFVIATPSLLLEDILKSKTASTEPPRYCFAYQKMSSLPIQDGPTSTSAQELQNAQQIWTLSRMRDSCHRKSTTSKIDVDWTLNFTHTGSCDAEGHTGDSWKFKSSTPTIFLILTIILISR